MTVIAFIITILGCLNWLSIGFFQYDFVAGFFGTQSSIFSRLIYIVIGIASIWLTYAVIRFKGRLTLKSKKAEAILLNKDPNTVQNSQPNTIQQNQELENSTQQSQPTNIEQVSQ